MVFKKVCMQCIHSVKYSISISAARAKQVATKLYIIKILHSRI